MSITFIPIIWTQSTAVPVAFERNSARVSSEIVSRLANSKHSSHIMRPIENDIFMFELKENLLSLPSWVVSIPLRVPRCWVLLLLVLTTHDHGLTAIIVRGRYWSLLQIVNIRRKKTIKHTHNAMPNSEKRPFRRSLSKKQKTQNRPVET